MLQRLLCAVMLVLCASSIWAQQQYRISGKIYDKATNEPMPFVSVYLLGTNIGAVSDVEGNYRITSSRLTDSIRATYIGYKNVTLPLKKNVAAQVVNIGMEINANSLAEVVIRPGENPAYRILRGVWANRDNNNEEKYDAYEYEVYNKMEFDLNNITEEFKQRKVLQPVKFIFDNIDSTNPTEKPKLPLFFSESVSDFYYRTDPRLRKEVIKGSKVSGVEDASISKLTGEMYQNANLYDNNILLFGKLFVSPISDNGIFYYKYYLNDSLMVGGHWCYHIQFKPRRKQELLFEGNMWIADTSFALKRIEMKITDDANINYVNAFSIIQEFDNASGKWMLVKEKMVADFALQDKKLGMYGRKTSSYKNIVVGKPRDEEFYTRTDNLVVQEGAEKRDSAFWISARHDSLNATERQIYAMVDSIQHLPVYKTWENVIITTYTGYKVMGPIELGPWYNTVSSNLIEGWRIRVGGRTSNSFSKWVELSGYTAYGFRDDDFKYSFAFKSFITKKPRQLVGGNYKNDYEILGQSNNAFTADNGLAALFRRTPLDNMLRVEQYSLWYERDWFPGLNTKLNLLSRNLYPLGSTVYLHPLDNGAHEFKPGITASEIQLTTRFAYQERYVESVFSRVSLGTIYPIVQVQYNVGLKGVFGSDYAYQRLSINVDDRIRINPIGYINYVLEAGKIWGTVPFPLMVLHAGNETIIYDWAAFNTMNYFEFASDQYAQCILIHHFDGFFLNKIPLMRKLKWREVVSFRGLVGSARADNRAEILFPSALYTLNRGPFMETGAGIENIFKFFRVDVFWRLRYLDHPGIQKVGVRISMQVLF
ncbi:MAG: DUF5686 and carboxypeptidase regulatory-like domain-containing protein [Bacteroidia bacterium]|jgi:hypothetical protein|nr:DUF5686 and carboxypeptidase regulatory-like domain-containing protein [Bacteroidia bacterium]